MTGVWEWGVSGMHERSGLIFVASGIAKVPLPACARPKPGRSHRQALKTAVRRAAMRLVAYAVRQRQGPTRLRRVQAGIET